MRHFVSLSGGFKLPLQAEDHPSVPLSTLPLPSQLVLALQDSQPCVSIGQQVLKYQQLANADSQYGTALHAPTSGRIIAIRQQVQALPGTPLASSLILEVDGHDAALPLNPASPAQLTRLDLALQLQEMGVTGNHGPLLPLEWATQQQALPLLIINAVEDEPGLAAVSTLLSAQADAVVAAIAMLEQVLQPTRIAIAIQQQQHAALKAMHTAAAGRNWHIATITAPYPAADEASLCTLLARPEESRFSLCLPVDAVAAAGAAILQGQPCISRMVSLGGKLARPSNVLALLGTPLSHVMAFAGAAACQDIGHGGSLRAYTLPAAQADALGLHWHSNCLQAIALASAPSVQDCVRCGDCARICPSQLQPQELYWHCRQQDTAQALTWGLPDCSLCGLCSAVCPSQLPLLEQFRHSALQYRSAQQQQQVADQARQRHRFRQLRLERDKQEKAQRLAERAAEQAAKREQAASTPQIAAKATTDSADKQAAIAAAMARAAQRNSQHQEKQSTGHRDDSQPDARAAAIAASRQATIDAAMARAAARKAAQDAAKAVSTDTHHPSVPANAISDKQALIEAAMQRAAAQKSAQAATAPTSMDADKKALIAAAMQRAAAQKTAQQAAQQEDNTAPTDKANGPENP
ncbi:4Fe-4S dicluster domain-containing protein [Aquitalea sp.]|uniref:4Fe-4S dicluster domain-containing protein n=1 Tax=Aquitalea sp. TaxID=1872623 RepID=UPI0025891785|nr:4Fe-4S dicluster domain-containing protein [Aquitalea sp.]